MSDISRPSVDGTTGPAGPEAGGSPAPEPEKLPAFGWRTSTRAELSFQLWEAWALIKHAFGIHTYIDVEDWSTEPMSIIAQECWLCPRRM